MKRNSATLKMTAMEYLSGKFGVPIVALLVLELCRLVPAMLINSTMDSTTTLGIITSQLLVYMVSLLLAVVGAGYYKLMLNLSRREVFSVKDLFYAFSHHPDRFLIVHLILLLIQFVVTLPLDLTIYMDKSMSATTTLMITLVSTMVTSLVNVILSLFFGLADFLMIDNADMGAMEAMKTSLRLLKGNRGRLFRLYLSFLPLAILCVFTCYVGFLWMMPYMLATETVFYMDIIGELDNPKPRTESTGPNPYDTPYGPY